MRETNKDTRVGNTIHWGMIWEEKIMVMLMNINKKEGFIEIDWKIFLKNNNSYSLGILSLEVQEKREGGGEKNLMSVKVDGAIVRRQ